MIVVGVTVSIPSRVDHANSWKLIKDHFIEIFKSIIFPMMCYSSDDDQLWQDDPYEYIRMKFGGCVSCVGWGSWGERGEKPSSEIGLSTDIFEDLVSPTVAATHFLSRACAKRKGTLDPIMAICVQILDTPTGQRDPSKKDGALHVIGQVAETLLKVATI